jgi:hypothetical protein
MPDSDDGPVTEPGQAELVQALRRHLADGRLDIGQFDLRVARVYDARTRVDRSHERRPALRAGRAVTAQAAVAPPPIGVRPARCGSVAHSTDG